MSSLPNTLKGELIRIARDGLVELPFSSIESKADVLFDINEAAKGDPCLAEQVSFLETTRLSQVRYQDIDNQKMFTIVNTVNGESIRFSNRAPMRNELRGSILRHYIDQARQLNAEQTLYQALTNAAHDPKHSDYVRQVTPLLMGDTAEQFFGERMQQAHFDAFVTIVVTAIQYKIDAGLIKGDLSPSDIRDNEHLKHHILQGIDLAALYDFCQHPNIEKVDPQLVAKMMLAFHGCALSQQVFRFYEEIIALEAKAETLQNRGYSHESQLALELTKDLKQELTQFASGEKSQADFVGNSRTLVLSAKRSSLADMRGPESILWGLLNALTAIASLGIANILAGRFSVFRRQNDSMQKVAQIEDALQSIPQI